MLKADQAIENIHHDEYETWKKLLGFFFPRQRSTLQLSLEDVENVRDHSTNPHQDKQGTAMGRYPFHLSMGDRGTVGKVGTGSFMSLSLIHRDFLFQSSCSYLSSKSSPMILLLEDMTTRACPDCRFRKTTDESVIGLCRLPSLLGAVCKLTRWSVWKTACTMLNVHGLMLLFMSNICSAG